MALDSATLSIALLTVLVSLAWPALIDEHRPLLLRFAAVTFPVLDSVLLAVLQRLWFAQRLKVPAVQLSMGSVLFLLAYHVVVLVELAEPGIVDPRWNQT